MPISESLCVLCGLCGEIALRSAGANRNGKPYQNRTVSTAISIGGPLPVCFQSS